MPTDQRYLPQRWPIKAGEVWHVGDHLIGCGDLGAGAGVALLDGVATGLPLAVSCVVTAPHWLVEPPGPGLADLDLITALAGTIRRSHAPLALISSSADPVDGLALIEMMAAHDFVRAAGWTIYRNRTAPGHLHLFVGPHASAETVRRAPSFNGLDDALVPRSVIACYTAPGATVFDPCLGLGATALAAAWGGRRCVGLERDPRKVSYLVDALLERGVPEEEVGFAGSLMSDGVVHG